MFSECVSEYVSFYSEISLLSSIEGACATEEVVAPGIGGAVVCLAVSVVSVLYRATLRSADLTCCRFAGT